jgi:hypothetical protein
MIDIWEIYLLHVLVQRDHLQVIHIHIKIMEKSYWVVSALYINGISLVQLIGLYCTETCCKKSSMH